MYSMDWALVNNALGLFVSLITPILLAALVASLVAGVFQAATQISDEAISFSSKLAAVLVVLAFTTDRWWGQILEFTLRVWGGSDFYH